MKQKIQWVKSIDDIQQNEKTFLENVVSVLPATLLSVLSALIFMGAAVLTLRDIYGIEMPSVLWVSGFVFVMFITSAVSEFSLIMNTGYSKYISAGVLILGATGFSSYFWKIERVQNFIGGIVAFLRLYARNWSARYGESVLWYEGNEKYIEDSVYFVLFFLFFVMLWIAKQIKNDGFMIWIPFIIIVTQLLVGRFPGGWAVFLFLAGLFLSKSTVWRIPDMQSARWRQRDAEAKMQYFFWGTNAAAMLVVCGVILLAGAGIAEMLIEKNADKAVTQAEKIKAAISENEIWNKMKVPEKLTIALEEMFLGKEPDYEELSNVRPEHKQIAVLEVEMKQKPSENLYLKGFGGDLYEQNRWVGDTEVLKGVCHEAGLSYEAVSEDIFYMMLDKLKAQSPEESVSEAGIMRNVGITYLGEPSAEVFYPYYAEAVTQGVRMEDGTLLKNTDMENIQFSQWNQNEYDFAGSMVKNTEWDALYESYVSDIYLKVPEELAVVSETAVQIEERMLKPCLDEQTETVNTENEMRLFKAELVAEWMENNTAYSLELPTLPEGVDPIEYFLRTSKSGYCMHYASAAVMLMRKMDVPARYVSGYLVQTDDFYESSSGYKAVVLDEQAHAWVEIYLNGIGWVPVEVTKSYPAIESTAQLLMNLPEAEILTGKIAGTSGIIAEAKKSEEADIKEETIEIEQKTEEEKTEEAAENEAVAETEEPDTAEVTENIEEPESMQESAKGKKTEEKKVEALPKPGIPKSVLGIILGCVVLIGTVAILSVNIHKFFKLESVYYKQLRKEMKRGNHKRVIILINSGIYRKLHYKKLLQPGYGDAAFEMALRENYTDLSKEEWNRYMEIVRSAAFSEREFTQEDAAFCYEVYRDIIYKDEVW